ncbi:MAG TPA: type VI secretion system baseplate subunit TssK [Geminicoccaceae bacterium]|nr:type VI secretion system baseplate subunit TssK [Geminicoccaceae bacterium]
MAGSDRVVWSEGMFLRTQHFQQQDRWVEAYVQGALADLVGHGWGFRRLELNTGLLATGAVALATAEGRLPDGTPFSIPDGADHPTPYQTAEGTPEGVVHLCLSAQQPGAPEFDAEGRPATGARHRGRIIEVKDAVAGTEGRAPLEAARQAFSIRHESDGLAGFVTLGLARIVSREADGGVVLDPEYFPPCLRFDVHPLLTSFLVELEGKLESIAASRVGYILDPHARGAAEVQDLLVLELVNRAKAQVVHLREQGTLHPERLYHYLAGLAGEMATYGAGDRRPPAFPTYRHPEPATAFLPLMATIRQLLVGLAKIEGKAVPVPLRLHRSGVWTTTEETTPELFKSAAFVLAVRAAVPAEQIRSRFPRLAVVGPAEEFNDLWNSRLRGIAVDPLPVAPRQIPFHAGTIYFELDRSGSYWRRLPLSAGLVAAVEGDWPELEFECWAIRD